MEVDREEIQQMADEIHESQEILTALGDHMRLHLILVMLHDGDSNGMRVGSIAEKARISRPAVSHHLQILKRAGIMKVRREGTKNYYYIDANMEVFDHLIKMLLHAKKIMMMMPDRSGDDFM